MIAAALLASLLRLADPSRITESVIVTAPDAGRIAVSATATVLTREALDASPSFTLDQTLGATPGFSLFRRASSRTANPTTQGVTLRGLSASGASRTLVMADDVPLNDPFGGWVYWNRVPAAAIARVEITRGGSSDLFGSDAMGGAIRVVSRRDRAAEARVEGGSHDTARLSAYGGMTGAVNVSGGFERSTSEGYIPVEPAVRGAVDTPAGSRHWSALGQASRAFDAVRIEAGGSFFDERRANGTVLQTNATRIAAGFFSASGEAAGGFWRARAHGADQDYDQTFSAVAAGRATERLVNEQHVDSRAQRIDASWSRAGAAMSWLAAASVRRVGADLLDQGALTIAEQHATGAGGQVVWRAAPRVTMSGGLHAEAWRSSSVALPDATARFLAARASLVYRVWPDATLRATVFNAYRAPTINELYRSFRVGAILTLPDPRLEPEKAFGGEAALTIARPRWTARAVVFTTALDGAIYNRTLPGPGPTTRMRSNGDARATGGEFELDARFMRDVSVWASVATGVSRFTSGQLDGFRLPQVPRASADTRYVLPQFDDDRNVFELERAIVANVLVSARAGRARVFASVENLFDARVEAGRTPLVTLGQPRMWQVGVRVFTR